VSKVKGKTREEVINSLAERIDKFEKYSTPHSQAMADMAMHMARRLGLSQADANVIAEAARLHDIGLLALSPAYHAAPTAPRFEERLDLWRHSIIGEQEMAKREASRYAQLLVRWHHEWWNGSGYPDMLSFEDIPIGARILRAVELYNALLSDRPYRAAFDKSEALEVLKSSAGIECDPYIVQALLALLEEMQANEAQETTVFSDEALTTSTLEEIKAQDEIATIRLNPHITTPELSSSSTVQEQPSNAQEPVETGSQSVWSNPTEPVADGVSNHQPSGAQESANSPFSVWSMPQETTNPPAASLEDTAQIVGDQADLAQPSASVEADARHTDNDPILQSPNPFDSLYEPLMEEQADFAQPAPPPIHPPPATEALPAPAPAQESATSSSTWQPETASPGATEEKNPEAISPQDEANHAPQVEAQAVIKQAPAQQLLSRLEPQKIEVDDSPNWLGWKESGYNQKSLLAFAASVLRQIQFSTVAIPFAGEAKLDWYLKAWGKRIFSNDSKAWAATVARALIESTETLSEEAITQLLTDIYIPGTRLMNPHLRRWFSEIDAWWMDNLRRNIEALEDDKLRAQACLLGMQTGDYALSFNEATADLRRPLTTVFWRLAGRFSIGALPHSQNRSYHYQPLDFIRNARADLLFLNLPASHPEKEGSQARFEWRECWVKGLAADAEDFASSFPAPQSKQAYLLKVDKMLSVGAHIKKWAIACQETGLISAREINELVKEHRAVRATYSKDVTEVAGGLRSYIIVAERE
jgi:HD-GYP domain-containing protein (c-di-GMP phosphodiesterase class II)